MFDLQLFSEDPNVTPGQSVATPTIVEKIPEDYEQLKALRDRIENEIGPVWDEFRPMLEDENRREFVKRAFKAYETQLEEADDTPSWFKNSMKGIREEFAPVVSYVNQEEAAKKARAEAETKRLNDENLAFASRLSAERPDLVENNYAKMHMLAAFAAREQISLEEAWKREGASFAKPVGRSKPVESLSAGNSAPGVPGPSSEQPIKSRKDLRNRMAASLRASMKG